MIDKEDFEQWRAHPVTEAVCKALVNLAEEHKQRWIDASWGGRKTDPVLLADLRGNADMALYLSDLTFEEMEQALNDKGTVEAGDKY